MKTFILITFLVVLSSCSSHVEENKLPFTHGPVLGAVTKDSIRVWGRTEHPSEFYIRYGKSPDKLSAKSPMAATKISTDNTGFVNLEKLEAGTQYFYAVYMDGKQVSPKGSFKTLQDSSKLKSKYNPKGLFNFSFEFACGNNQSRGGNSLGPGVPVFDTLNSKFRKNLDFAIQNGDWVYEEKRDYTVPEWQKQTATKSIPQILKDVPNLPGVWENYKLYMDRAPNLMEWHRNIPSYFTFDDHELVNDIIGAGTPGYRNRRAVFRDIGVQGWYDYLGWANPVANKQPIHFGKAQMKAGSNLLIDKSADFTAIDLNQASNLHVHWGTEDAGMMDSRSGDDLAGGDPNSMVYDIVKVIDKHTIQLSHPAKKTSECNYSIGRYSYGTFKVANCRFILLDTKSHRDVHDIKNPAKKGISMIGKNQREWMMDLMAKKDADFYFVVSSVNFMIPHVGGGGGKTFFAATKDDAWTVFYDEREKLIDFWDKLGKKVFVLTGDLHNSFAIKITDSVWEFASGPHNSVNHRAQDEGNRPVNGPFKYGPRPCNIRWSTTAMADIAREARMFPHFCVIKVNNVFNNPKKLGGDRKIAYPIPHVLFQFYDALTGELKYVESVHAK